ncbi:Uncharacterized protein dnl_38410 [Desulfonema limicola]|uniref:Uncharacterized protein n=1 Tax=Desulfonema limicola TaxID=45656 RepID=A0A975BA49_9BACT|nr:Uncharacterized protein dnl_38410 [Desulfonema limicola]
MKKGNKFDIRHKETLTLFLREYFELFFPDLAHELQKFPRGRKERFLCP